MDLVKEVQGCAQKSTGGAPEDSGIGGSETHVGLGAAASQAWECRLDDPLSSKPLSPAAHQTWQLDIPAQPNRDFPSPTSVTPEVLLCEDH